MAETEKQGRRNRDGDAGGYGGHGTTLKNGGTESRRRTEKRLAVRRRAARRAAVPGASVRIQVTRGPLFVTGIRTLAPGTAPGRRPVTAARRPTPPLPPCPPASALKGVPVTPHTPRPPSLIP